MTMTVLKMLRIQDVMQRNEREVQGEYIYIYSPCVYLSHKFESLGGCLKQHPLLTYLSWHGRQSPTLDREIVTSSSTLKIQIEVWKGDEKTPSTSVNLSDVDADLASRRVGVNGMAKDMFTFAFKVKKKNEKS